MDQIIKQYPKEAIRIPNFINGSWQVLAAFRFSENIESFLYL